MNHHLLTVIATLTLGAAGAQTTGVSLPGTVPASVSRTQADTLAAFLKAGGQVQLLNAGGAVIGTLNPDGTVTLVGDATLADARKVQVVPAAGQGEPMTYTLARDLSSPGAIKFQIMGPNGKMLALPLSAIINRQAGRAVSTDRLVKRTGQPGKAEKPDKSENPGKGKGGRSK